MSHRSAKANSILLPFSVIAAAVNGNVDAINSVLRHYEGYSRFVHQKAIR